MINGFITHFLSLSSIMTIFLVKKTSRKTFTTHFLSLTSIRKGIKYKRINISFITYFMALKSISNICYYKWQFLNILFCIFLVLSWSGTNVRIPGFFLLIQYLFLKIYSCCTIFSINHFKYTKTKKSKTTVLIRIRIKTTFL